MWLIDLNPFGEVTDSLLFSWEELTSGEITQQQVGLRFMFFFCFFFSPLTKGTFVSDVTKAQKRV